MKALLASLTIAAPAVLTAWVGTAATWAALVASPLVTAGSPESAAPALLESATLETREVIPAAFRTAADAERSPEGVSGAPERRANHSLDAIRFKGRTYLAYRNAQRHEPDVSAEIIVVSSSDERHWRQETTIKTGSEVRHPAFLELHDQLFLYASTLSNLRYAIQPQSIIMTTKAGDEWSALSELDLAGQIITQLSNDAGMPLMVVTVGAHSPFELGALPPTVRLLTTSDGYGWQPLTGQDDSGMAASATRLSFSREEDGNSLGVINRSVNGSETGMTSVCLATGEIAAAWDCTPTSLDLWNPSTFRSGLYTYVLGGLAVDAERAAGPERTKHDLAAALTRVSNEVGRLASRQRCGIWRVDPRSRQLVPVAELPSKGHECNAKALPDGETGRVTIYSVSSPATGGDPSLVEARRGRTHIYRHDVQLSIGTRVPEATKQTSLSR